jgi:hypothetical protein
MLHKIGDHYINLDGLAHVWVNPNPVPHFVYEDGTEMPRTRPHLMLAWNSGTRLALYDADAQAVIALLDTEIEPDVPAQSVSERA